MQSDLERNGKIIDVATIGESAVSDQFAEVVLILVELFSVGKALAVR